ncbi:MAG: succinate dehydrogenase [Chlamydiia bacterium]|nr:succinate dehydrogenase [Chlamydiia bacterium]MCP5509504.1 succinate dehydrogenase [Chlamydiales bacterium]
MLTASKAPPIPRAYIWRRVHSLFGLWLAIFLVEHLLTNSQAALFFGDNGKGFIYFVNFLKNLPYLPVVEVSLLGIPILVHGIWGIQYILRGKANSHKSDGSKPSLGKYGRNQAYTWQRYTAWILLIGIIAHVGFMRFYLYPITLNQGAETSYFVRLNMDPGLYTVASRLDVQLYNQAAIDQKVKELGKQAATKKAPISEDGDTFSAYEDEVLTRAQRFTFQKEFVEELTKRKISKTQVIAVANNFGTATLLTVRDSFRQPVTCILYTIFVLAAVFHAYNGLWTFMITWGIVMRMRSQKRAVNVCVGIMMVMLFLGLAAIWGTYFINLKS